jgi:hypothetical protein
MKNFVSFLPGALMVIATLAAPNVTSSRRNERQFSERENNIVSESAPVAGLVMIRIRQADRERLRALARRRGRSFENFFTSFLNQVRSLGSRLNI